MSRTAPVVLIGLDAGELSLIESLCAAGQLPTLESLARRGCCGSLRSEAELFAGGVWPTFYTGREVPWHGIYHNRLWRTETMRCEPASEARFPARPFWELLDASRYRVVVVDVPMTIARPKPVNGVQLAGWGTHDLVMRASWPGDLWRRLESEFGPPKMPPEQYGAQSAKGLLELKRRLVEACEQMASVGEALLEGQVWDLFALVLGAAHRAGHYLWDSSQVELAGEPENSSRALEQALSEVYRACDSAIARLLERVPGGSRILVFSLHGMRRNPGWSDYCADILSAIQGGQVGATTKTGFKYRLNRVLPRQLIRPLTTRLPADVQDRLVSLWYANQFDWGKTRCFPLAMDHAGYFRVNLKGRERRGTVEPGSEYAALCRDVKEALLSFRDVRTGEPIVGKVHRLDELAPPEAPYRDTLPDLVVTWGQVSAIESPVIWSAAYGEMCWEPAGRLPSGRAGNHRREGWFIAVGDGIPPGTRADGFRVVDLLPTILSWLGADQPEGLPGTRIPALCP